MAGDDQRLVFIRLKELIRVGYGPHMRGVGDRALGEVGVRGLQTGANLLQADAIAINQRRIYADSYGWTRTAPGENLADTLHLSQLLREDRVGCVVELSRRDVCRREGKKRDGSVGRIDFAITRLRGQICGQLRTRGVDGGLHVAGGGIDVAVEVELKDHAGVAEAA